MNKSQLTALEAINIAHEYINERNKYFVPWTIQGDISKSVQYYEKFFALHGGAWVVEIDFVDFDKLLVISDEDKGISFLIFGIKRSKLSEINTLLTIERVLEISRNYNDEYQIEGAINFNHGESIAFYERFEGVEGYTWAVNMKVPPSPFGGGDTVSLILSDEQACVEYMFDPSGYQVTPHLDDEDEDDEDDE
ncbi:hypothetical protein [Paenibacillus sanguinis]|uniref:hypothetical protein n=1 Tax=Paenibacillus sanguinis TaxID=225906 RepID=UPI0003A606CB|nr:hypothetical protein [Paenibacillus sanguinis]